MKTLIIANATRKNDEGIVNKTFNKMVVADDFGPAHTIWGQYIKRGYTVHEKPAPSDYPIGKLCMVSSLTEEQYKEEIKDATEVNTGKKTVLDAIEFNTLQRTISDLKTEIEKLQKENTYLREQLNQAVQKTE